MCKPTKKKSPGDYNGAKTLPRSFRGDSGRAGGGAGGGAGPGCSRGRGVQPQARSHEDPCYQPSAGGGGGGGDRSWSACVTTAPLPPSSTTAAAAAAIAADPHADATYGNIAAINASPPAGSATLKRKKPLPTPVPSPPQLPPPVPKKPASSGSPAPPPRAQPPQPPPPVAAPGENYYESISEVKPGGGAGG